MASRRGWGFTLIELMIVVAIIGILAAIAVPKFADLVRKSREGQSKGNLGALRSALSIYYADMEGNYPYDLNSLSTGGKYLSAIPAARASGYHAESAVIKHNWGIQALGCSGPYLWDSGQWIYWNDPGTCVWPPPAGYAARNLGEVWVGCTHTDTKGTQWTSY